MEYGLSLGSNQGDRLALLREARQQIAQLADGVEVTASSPVYETEPVDVAPAFRDQPFLNAVLIVTTQAVPAALAAQLHAIEARLGRVRGADRNAPRPLDIDLIYAGELVQADAALRLPHPRWVARRFVVEPLADVRPELILPGAQQTVRAVLDALPATPKAVVFAREW